MAEAALPGNARPGTGGAGIKRHPSPLPSPLSIVARRFLHPMMALWMVSGAFVIIEPSPYELVFLVVLPFALFGGIGIHRRAIGMFQLLVLFIPFALIGAFQVTHMSVLEGIIYVMITAFLWFTGYIAANYIADDPQKRLGGMMRAYMFVAVLISIIGILAYLDLIPGAEMFLRYDRVKSTFQDPNV
ncbi:MAG TPA: hypothetical protein ENJ68_00075, partial [Devosia sp.]|nr:hypothetical protein [Devosia sp.]